MTTREQTMKLALGTAYHPRYRARQRDPQGRPIPGWELRGRRLDRSEFREWFRTKTELLAWHDAERDRQSRARAGLPAAVEHVTYERLCVLYLDQAENDTTWRKEMLAYSRRRFGSLQVRQIRSDEIATWLAKLTRQNGNPLASKTKRHIRDTMRAVLARGTAWGYLTANPITPTAVPPPKPKRQDVFPLTDWTQVETVAAKAGGQHGRMIRFACASGLRPEEYLALNRDDVDFAAKRIHVRRVMVDGKVKAEGKTDAAVPRDVVLTARAEAALREGPTPLRPDGVWFPNTTGGYLNLDNWRSRVWHPAVKDAELDPRPPYQCRHTFATLALAATDGDLAWVAEQLGHTDIQTTRRHYARYLPQLHKRKLAQLNQAWSAEADASGLRQVQEG